MDLEPTIYSVLKVPEDAQQKDIQLAFMERRMEIYKTLQALESKVVVAKTKGGKEVELNEKTMVEKQMDELVAGFRILRDPKKRRRYDTKLRRHRAKNMPSLARSTPEPKKKPNRNARNERSSPNSVLDMGYPSQAQGKGNDWLPEDLKNVGVESNDGGKDDEGQSKTILKTSSSKGISASGPAISGVPKDGSSYSVSKSYSSRTGSADSASTTTTKSDGSETYRPDRDEEDIEQYYQDVVAQRETTLGSWLRNQNFNDQANAIDNMTSEVVGSVADLWLSVSQVFGAFSIDDDAIDALSGNIDEASRDLRSGKYA